MLSATDPLGRLIYLSQETWDEHIVKRHSDIVPDWITETIEDPDFITQDNTKRPRCYLQFCYYKLNLLPERRYPRQYLKVVARQKARRSPFRVMSAHPAHHLKLSEEEIVWTPISQ